MTEAVAPAYSIEFAEPSTFNCDCCGGLTVRLTRFVFKDRDAFAVYYAAYSNNHAENELGMLVSLGEWGEGSEPAQRVAFYCRVRPTDDSYEVMLGDAADSAWGDVEIMGEMLSRDAARQHRWKATAFEVLDDAFVQDPSLIGFLHRVHCGDAATPLEKNFGLPDDVFALGDEAKGRAEIGRSFVALDASRFYVRCLLSLPVESYGDWNIGLWVEVSKNDFNHLRKVWDDPIEYPKVKFSGILSNDLVADVDLPIEIGAELQFHILHPDRPPIVLSSTDGQISQLLSRTWSKSEFETYAVAHGFL